jgi:2-oxoglutarate dehydrogenase E1 component
MTFMHDFAGPNAGYVLELYERYRQDPNSVDAETRAYFDHWEPDLGAESTATPTPITNVEKIVGAVNLANAIRQHGHTDARLDPLDTPPPGDPSLRLSSHHLTPEDLRSLPPSLIGGPVANRAANALEAIEGLRTIYSGTLGYDYGHVQNAEERAWLRNAIEAGEFRPPKRPIDSRALLDRLTQVEAFEQFLQKIFPGKFRFSIEGLDTTVPILDEIIQGAAAAGKQTVLIGMAHRGRLNVLTHILNKPYPQILAEFKDPVYPHRFTNNLGWMGDVKYHAGAYRTRGADSGNIAVQLAPNPSHLEAVNPVVEGMARAAGTKTDSPGMPKFDPTITLPILIHGDAAFPGQGVVAETLNLSRLPGYWTGGTIHIIGNNQLGFTTDPKDDRSTLYASDLAKGFEIPIVHVNADDPEACIEVARLAFAYRRTFHKDFLIDLIGYRRYGHNEGDEPGFTQPAMYQVIQKHKTVRALWAETLTARGAIVAADAASMLSKHNETLQNALAGLNPETDLVEPIPTPPPPGAARQVRTVIPLEHLQDLNAALLDFPKDFHIHPKLQKTLQKRRENVQNVDDPTIDWATAEQLAFASILADGTPIRLTGQDVERGTFSQRHAVFNDAENGTSFIPLASLHEGRASFEIRNSPLSENAVLGFEYGYNIQQPRCLVLWEAQYGDFNNGAQTVIDEFITSARAKWGQTPSLVMLLPHGMEGSGPDHASARLERFLQLAADTNIRIANCTTAAQYFHLLRRQAAILETDPLPLIVMTPKSLLRNARVMSSQRELAEGKWQAVLHTPNADPNGVRRLLVGSGKICVDLVTALAVTPNPAIALANLEQLYPFPTEHFRTVIARYLNLEEIVWIQEEPSNMGAQDYVKQHLYGLLPENVWLKFIARPANASPAEGSAAVHQVNQQSLIDQGLKLDSVAIKQG